MLSDIVEQQGVESAPEIVVDEDPTEWTLRRAVLYVLKVRTNVVLIAASSLGYFFFAGLKTFAMLYVRGHYGVSQAIATVLVLVVGAGAVGGVLIAGRKSDQWIRRGRVTARLDVGTIGYVVGAVMLVPVVLSGAIWVGLPLMVVAAGAIAGPNATLDAARLDVVPSHLWGRAEGVRTVARTVLEAAAPLVFGFLADAFGSTGGGLGAAGGGAKAAVGTAAQVHGLGLAFLIMLIPLAASGVILVTGRRSYPVDIASAAESQELLSEMTPA